MHGHQSQSLLMSMAAAPAAVLIATLSIALLALAQPMTTATAASCVETEWCERVYGEQPEDVQDYGNIAPCQQHGWVPCLSVRPGYNPDVSSPSIRRRLGSGGSSGDQQQSFRPLSSVDESKSAANKQPAGINQQFNRREPEQLTKDFSPSLFQLQRQFQHQPTSEQIMELVSRQQIAQSVVVSQQPTVNTFRPSVQQQQQFNTRVEPDQNTLIQQQQQQQHQRSLFTPSPREMERTSQQFQIESLPRNVILPVEPGHQFPMETGQQQRFAGQPPMGQSISISQPAPFPIGQPFQQQQQQQQQQFNEKRPVPVPQFRTAPPTQLPTIRPTVAIVQQQRQITSEIGGNEIVQLDRESAQQLLAILRSLAGAGGGSSSSSVQPIVAPVFPLPLEQQQNNPSNGRF